MKAKGKVQKAKGANAAIRVSWLVICVLCVLCVLCGEAFATTVTGTLIDSSGSPIPSGKVTFQITNYGAGNIPRVQGTGIVVSTQPIVATANASGQFTATIQGNDTITPAGTEYLATFYSGSSVYLQAVYSITGSSVDLSTLTPSGAIPAVPPNTAYTTIEQAGSPLQQRQILNFTSLTCTDNSANARTDCAGGGSGSGPTLETNGTRNGSQSLLNLLNGTDITLSNSGGTVTFNFTGTLPQTPTVAAHNWLNSYNASTGAFTATQPALSDISLPSETANYFWAAPNGSAGTPSFRAIVAADIPTLNQSTTGNAATATALAATPNQCTGSEFATGIAANGNANCGTPTGAGTVTSVGLSLPSIFNVSGSPVTGSGTLTGALASQSANLFFASPNGSAGTPSFRAIVAADIPTLNQSTTGNAATATALAAAPTQCSNPLFVTGIAASGNANCIGSQTANYVYAAPNGSNGTPTFRAIVAADIPTLNQSTTGNAATATALAAAPTQCSNPLFVTGIAASGNANCIGSQTANFVYAAPNGSAGTPTFRAIVAADIPTLNQSTTGNAATATALAAAPSQCSSGQLATGIAASGNANCDAPNRKLALAVASCNAGTAAPDWAPGSTAPTAACTSDNQDATLNFQDGGIAYLTLQIPSDYSSFNSFSFSVTTTDTTTSHTIIFDIQSYCVAAGAAIGSSPTYNTAGSATLHPTSTASQIVAGTISSMTMTGCAAGDYMRLALSRATDTDTDTAVKFLNAPVWAYNSSGVGN